jgi:hypothetical protein
MLMCSTERAKMVFEVGPNLPNLRDGSQIYVGTRLHLANLLSIRAPLHVALERRDFSIPATAVYTSGRVSSKLTSHGFSFTNSNSCMGASGPVDNRLYSS